MVADIAAFCPFTRGKCCCNYKQNNELEPILEKPLKMQEKIENILRETFSPETLKVINESHKHAGHAGHDGSGESHFRVIISAKDITSSSRLEKHRAVIAALGDIMQHIHALQLDLK